MKILIPSLALVLAAIALAADAAPLVFDWPDGSRADVLSTSERGQDRSEMSYGIALRRLPTQEDYELNFQGVTLVSLNGIPADDPRLAQRLGPMRALLTLMPSMRISEKGDFVGAVGLDALVAEMLKLLPADLSPEDRLRFGEYFRSAPVLAQLERRTGTLWDAWVGSWAGQDISIGETRAGIVPIQVGGRTLEQAVSIDNLGYDEKHEGQVRLRLVTTIEGVELVTSSETLMRDVARRAVGRGYRPDQFQSARLISVTEAVTDPATLKPSLVERMTQAAVTTAAGEQFEDDEKTRYVFLWH